MQLDRTLIAVHERNLLETFDLSLHVVRKYAWPLAVTFAIGAIPLAILNHFLVGWIMNPDVRESFFYVEEAGMIALLVGHECPGLYRRPIGIDFYHQVSGGRCVR